ncbi:ATP-binding protein [Kitasatospora sp. RB6PN24]|uniref:ATP-binding protein n=1 Tax=Kitasatospora humi TaxID=2893891 RepID=UPI001E5B33B2|nr:ATP-binding protein [Kitasatospora humi]MCC9306356.1 ATP-binding protein [Kitasatospora humi]
MSAIELTAPAEPEAIGEVRHRLRQAMESRELLGSEQIADLLLMVSEAATNGLLHGCDPARDDEELTIAVRLMDGVRVRTEVTDPGTGAARQPKPGEEDEHGRGLEIIAELSSDFGVVFSPEGARTTWFELVARTALPEPDSDVTANAREARRCDAPRTSVAAAGAGSDTG